MSTPKAGHIARLIAYYGLTRHLPDSTIPGGSIFRKLRYWSSRKLFLRCGSHVNIERGAYIGCGRGISIGDYSGIGINAWIGGGTTIGSHVMMGPDVMIFSRNHQSSRLDIPMSEQGVTHDNPVTIGDDVWIGARSILLPGIQVGRGSIVGAGAVVVKDVPPYAVVVGNPARVVRYRSPGQPLGSSREPTNENTATLQPTA
jgi:maltose O-acetyltransferase